jgi:polar amino acid transport system permease protein
MRTCLPVLVNEMSLLIKASPAVAVAGIVDVTRRRYALAPTTIGRCRHCSWPA